MRRSLLSRDRDGGRTGLARARGSARRTDSGDLDLRLAQLAATHTRYTALMPRPARATPAQLTPGWPDEHSPDSLAEVARRFAMALRSAIGTRSLRQTAAVAGVSHTAILAILAGSTWPDLATIAKLEAGLGVDLWPGREQR